MARFVRAAATAVNNGTATSITLDMDADLTSAEEDPVEPVAPGDFMLAEFRSRNPAVAPDGWTQLGNTLDESTVDNDPETGLANHSLWYRVAEEDEPSSYTFEQNDAGANANGFMALGISVFADVDPDLLAVAGMPNANQPADPTTILSPFPAEPNPNLPSQSLRARLWGASRASSIGAPVAMQLIRGDRVDNRGVRYSVITSAAPGQQCMTLLVAPHSPIALQRPARAIDSTTGGSLNDNPTFVDTGRRNAFTVTVPSAPLVPRHPQAQLQSDTAIRVSWDPFQTGVRYRVQFGTAPFGPGNGEQVYDGAAAQFLHQGLQPDTTYYYRVQSYSDNLQSAWTALVSATTTEPPAPGDIRSLEQHDITLGFAARVPVSLIEQFATALMAPERVEQARLDGHGLDITRYGWVRAPRTLMGRELTLTVQTRDALAMIAAFAAVLPDGTPLEQARLDNKAVDVSKLS